MALIPILIGGALLVGGGLAVTHANKRQPLPADIRAQVVAAFQSGNEQTITLVINAIRDGAAGKYAGQANVIEKALKIGRDATVPSDVSALWWAAIRSGDPKTMRTTSEGLRVKYNALASALLDCARILGG
jgi:hypothetical protein